jgi:cullin 1
VVILDFNNVCVADGSLDFKSKKVRVNLNLSIGSTVSTESSDVFKAVAGDRKYVIQSAIVRCVLSLIIHILPVRQNACSFRIMKARTTMNSQSLIQEVISQISLQFTPKISDVKKVSGVVCLAAITTKLLTFFLTGN